MILSKGYQRVIKMIIKDVQCPMCHGMGYVIEPVTDEGYGPKEYCGYCDGKGVMRKVKLYYQCLGWLSAAKRAKIKKHIRRVK